MMILVALTAAAVQASPTTAAADQRTAFCWATITNAVLREASSTGRMPTGDLAQAMIYSNGKIRGRYANDDQLVAAMRAGSRAFDGVANPNDATSDCLRELREEMSRFTDLAIRSMDR